MTVEEKMRKIIIAVLALVFITGCSISEEEYRKVVNDLREAKQEIERLKIKIDALNTELEKKSQIKWEYKEVLVSANNFENELNSYGDKGWEIVDFNSITRAGYLTSKSLKRPGPTAQVLFKRLKN